MKIHPAQIQSIRQALEAIERQQALLAMEREAIRQILDRVEGLERPVVSSSGGYKGKVASWVKRRATQLAIQQ